MDRFQVEIKIKMEQEQSPNRVFPPSFVSKQERASF